jgi:hypothetical protein
LRTDSKQGKAQRLMVLCIVAALHIAVGAFLVASFRTRLSFPTARGIEWVYLPSVVPERPPPMPVVAKNTQKPAQSARVPLPRSSPPTFSVVPLEGTLQSAPSVDWAEQARLVAAEQPKNDLAGMASGPLPKSPFAPPPIHHSGEEFVTATGDHGVFINAHCYQVSKTISDFSNGISNGMGTQTYCISPSNNPRGDLFDQLPAYKKRHPDP